MTLSKIFRRWNPVIFVLVLCSCSKPVVNGRVMDAFGQPIAAASVTIEGTSLSAETDGAGTYKIGFVPGQFTIRIKKDGYTTASLSLNVAQSTTVPAADILLYPRPTAPGIYYIGKKGLEPLATSPLRRQGVESTISWLPGSTHYLLQTGAAPVFAEGDAQFIDTVQKEMQLVRAQNRSGRILDASSGDPAGGVSATAEKVGEEKLTIWRVHLTPGAYGWIPLEQNLLGDFVPGQTYYAFQVGTDPWSSLPLDLPPAVSAFLARSSNLELAGYDAAEGTVTLRSKTTGETITVTVAAIEEGRLVAK